MAVCARQTPTLDKPRVGGGGGIKWGTERLPLKEDEWKCIWFQSDEGDRNTGWRKNPDVLQAGGNNGADWRAGAGGEALHLPAASVCRSSLWLKFGKYISQCHASACLRLHPGTCKLRRGGRKQTSARHRSTTHLEKVTATQWCANVVSASQNLHGIIFAFCLSTLESLYWHCFYVWAPFANTTEVWCHSNWELPRARLISSSAVKCDDVTRRRHHSHE